TLRRHGLPALPNAHLYSIKLLAVLSRAAGTGWLQPGECLLVPRRPRARRRRRTRSSRLSASLAPDRPRRLVPRKAGSRLAKLHAFIARALGVRPSWLAREMTSGFRACRRPNAIRM